MSERVGKLPSPQMRRAITITVGFVVAVGTALLALRRTASYPVTSTVLLVEWAGWVATAVASAMAAFRLLAGPVATGRDAGRATDVILRAWLGAFVVILLVVQGVTALRHFQSLQQQRLCANAVLRLKLTPAALRASGLRCGP